MPELRNMLPLLDASFILASGIAIIIGRFFIVRGKVSAHKRSMISATVLAALFLIVYLTRWTLFGTKLFAGQAGSTWHSAVG